MLVTLKRINTWLVKGFDGASQMVIDRTIQGKVPDQDTLDCLDRIISNLEAVVHSRIPGQSGEAVDHLLFPLLLEFCEILHYRVMREGALDSTDRENLTKYLQNLKIARERFHEATVASKSSCV